jgi:hypothetical protein
MTPRQSSRTRKHDHLLKYAASDTDRDWMFGNLHYQRRVSGPDFPLSPYGPLAKDA